MLSRYLGWRIGSCGCCSCLLPRTCSCSWRKPPGRTAKARSPVVAPQRPRDLDQCRTTLDLIAAQALKTVSLSDPEFVMIGPAKDAAQDKTDGSSLPEFTREQELAALRDMLLIRRFEEKAGQLYGMGAIGGFCHLYIGQEAVVVGMQMALKDGDQVITGYRDHGHMLACGMDAKGVMAELTGRRGGYSKGKGGSMHMFSLAKHFYGGHGIVGAQVPLGTGLGFRQPLSRQRFRVPHLFRRWRCEPRSGLRELQHGGALETAGRLCDRE